MTLRVDVGSGERPYDDGSGTWVHLDSRPIEHVDYVGSAEDLTEHFLPESVDALRSTHLLEHFGHREVVPVLRTWREVLRPGGVLYVEVPNLGWQVAALAGQAPMEGKTVEEIVVLMFGEQDHEGNFHKNGFTQESLGATLSRAGFVDVQVIDIGMVLCASCSRPAG